MKKVTIYTDGACKGNPGPGGWAAILLHKDKHRVISGGEQNTTNNRMELMAVIEGLKALKYPCEVDLYTDSAYIVNAVKQNWINKWKSNNWMRPVKNKRLELKNKELWQEIDRLFSVHRVYIHKVAGHSGDNFNEMADQYAGLEAEKYLSQ